MWIFLGSRPYACFRLRVFAMIAGKLTLQGKNYVDDFHLLFSFDGISFKDCRFNKRPICHIANLKNHFKSINTFAQSYDYIIMLIWREMIHHFLLDNWMVLICKTLSSFDPRMLMPSLVENWPNGYGEEYFLISSVYFRYFEIILALHVKKPKSPLPKFTDRRSEKQKHSAQVS